MSSIFSRIVNGEIPCYKVAESENYLAFLDINPLVKGHTLVIPKKEIDNIFDLDDALLSGLTVFSKQVAIGINKVISCERIGMTVIGLDVPHAHIHLIPINNVNDMNFGRPKLDLTHEQFQAIASEISLAI